MSDVIDLRPYLTNIFKSWRLILLFVIISVVIATIFILRAPPRYKSVAFVAIIERPDVVQFDPRFTEVNERQPIRAFPELAKNDAILSAVIDRLPEEELTLRFLQRSLIVNSGTDFTLLEMSMTAEDPQFATKLVNVWSEEFVSWANQVFGDQSNDEITFYEEQLNLANQALDEREQDLIAFQSINRSEIISNTLNFKQNQLTNLLSSEQEFQELQTSISATRERVERQSNGADISYADQLIYLQILQRSIGDASSPIVFLEPNQELVTSDKSEFLALIDGLERNLSLRLTDIREQIEGIEPSILSLQLEQQRLLAQENRLTRAVEIAEETSTSLEFKYQQEQLAFSDSESVFRLVSRASIPTNKVNARAELQIAISVIMGGLLGVVATIARTYYELNSQEGAS